MPHITRDPETGQFVSAETGHTTADFRDYEFKHVKTTWDVDAGDLPGAFPIEEEDLVTIDLDDIVHRGERADLVALQLHGLQASVPGTSSAEGNIRVDWELSTGTGSATIFGEDAAESFGNGGSSGVVDLTLFTSDDPDILYFVRTIAENSFADTSTGIGGGADANVITAERHYPREFGACPSFDERDEISESWMVTAPGSAEPTDSLIRMSAAYTLVFVVEEEDHRR